MSTDGDLRESRAILIGVSAYDDLAFTPIPAVRNSLNGMRALLADPALCAWLPDTVTVIPDPRNPGLLARQIRELARKRPTFSWCTTRAMASTPRAVISA